jgi:hypothetical protein
VGKFLEIFFVFSGVEVKVEEFSTVRCNAVRHSSGMSEVWRAVDKQHRGWKAWKVENEGIRFLAKGFLGLSSST